MHKHDPDLIMALAEGQLSASDASQAAADVATCAECSADLEAQRIALEALHGAPTITLTKAERQRLRSSLRTELGLTEAPAPVPAAPHRPRRRWSLGWALGGAAAVLVAVLAIAPALRLISAGDYDDAADLVAADSTTTTVASESAPAAGVEQSPLADRLSADDTESATTTTAAARDTTTTRAPEATTAAPQPSPPRVALEPGDNPQEGLTEFFAFNDRAGGDLGVAIEQYAKSAPATTPTPEPTACVPAAELGIADNVEPVVVAAVLIDGTRTPVIAYADPASGDLVLVVYLPDTCEIAFSLR
jgi:hypothetical protein